MGGRSGDRVHLAGVGRRHGPPRGAPERPPVSVGGRIGDWVTGMFAVLGVLTSRHRAARDAADGLTGELLDISMLESLMLTQTMYPATHLSIAGRGMRSQRTLNFPGVERTKDGWVGFMVVTGQQWLDFCAMVERPDWLDDPTLVVLVDRHARHAELRAGHLGLDAASAPPRRSSRSPPRCGSRRPRSAAVAPSPNSTSSLRATGTSANPRSGFLQPDVPYTLSNGAGRRPPSPAPRSASTPRRLLETPTGGADHPARSRRSSRPTSAPPVRGHAGRRLHRVLGRSDHRPLPRDVRRRRHPRRVGAAARRHALAKRPRTMDEDQWWEWGSVFHGPNTDKLGLTLDLQSDEAAAWHWTWFASATW